MLLTMSTSDRGPVLPVAGVLVRLRLAREARGMTQGETGREAGLTMQQVSLIETGGRGLSLAEFVALCHAVRLDPRDVMTDAPVPVAWV